MAYLNDAIEVLKVFGPAGVAGYAVKYALNGSRDAIRRIETKTDHTTDLLYALGERTTRIEAHLDVTTPLPPAPLPVRIERVRRPFWRRRHL